jgi:hypothetical protein
MTATSPVAVLSGQANGSDRNPSDYLSFHDIETQYPGCITAGTLAVWASTRRYDFHRIVTKIGRNSRIRRDRWEAFLNSNTPGTATCCTCGIPSCQEPQGLQTIR